MSCLVLVSRLLKGMQPCGGGGSQNCAHCRAVAGRPDYGCLYLQTVVELFLGLRRKTYFPSARLPYTDSLPKGEDSDSEDSDADDPSLSAVASKVCTVQWLLLPLLVVCATRIYLLCSPRSSCSAHLIVIESRMQKQLLAATCVRQRADASCISTCVLDCSPMLKECI